MIPHIPILAAFFIHLTAYHIGHIYSVLPSHAL